MKQYKYVLFTAATLLLSACGGHADGPAAATAGAGVSASSCLQRQPELAVRHFADAYAAVAAFASARVKCGSSEAELKAFAETMAANGVTYGK